MAKIKLDQNARDILAFMRIADAILHFPVPSLRLIAKHLEVSTTSIRSCLERLEAFYACPLVLTKPRSQEGMSLTEGGQQLYQTFKEMSGKNALRRHKRVRLHISHSLITSDLIAPVLAETLASLEEGFRELLHPRASMDFRDVVADVQRGELDFAMVYGAPRRLERLPAEVQALKAGPEIKFVAVCRTPLILADIVSNGHLKLERMANYKFVGLERDGQPVPTTFPSDWPLRLNYVQVDTYDAALAFVRSGVGDIALLPSIFRGLSHDKANSELYMETLTEPTIRLAILHKARLFDSKSRNETTPASTIINLITTKLDKVNLEDTSTTSLESNTTRFVRDHKWYEKIKHGYYIECTSDDLHLEKWHSETVELERRSSSKPGHLEFAGKIVNCCGARFDIQLAMVVDELFFVIARKINDEATSVAAFATIFNYCLEKEGVLCGLWSGKDKLDRRVLKSTIWSQEELPLNRLINLANEMSWSMTTNTRLDFGLST